MDRLADADLSALFGIEMDADGAHDAPMDVAIMSSLTCSKCGGSGKFKGYTGRVVGNCFSCEGTGVPRSAGVALKPDDCTKCCGTGEYSPGRSCLTCSGSGKMPQDEAIGVEQIAVAFDAARASGVKTPRLRLDTFVFSMAPAAGKNPGAIYVKRDGEYLGKISEGRFSPTRSCDAETTGRVIWAAANPAESAKAFGLRTGVCSCCGRELTNGLSIDLGIGPICRDKYGWGG